MNKPQLRQFMRSQLASAARADDAVRLQTSHWISQLPAPATIATYAALDDEIDLLSFITQHPMHRWVLPVVINEDLTFKQVQCPKEQLSRGRFGIAEPIESCPSVPIHAIDVFLCPGLAFDQTGGRLGRGRGFYDRALAHARADALRIGICQPFQKVPSTFAEAHDIRMHLVFSGHKLC